ncbi:hypothetical protein DPMN_032771 [Dreissena polymorpha]|uniref:Uncharacterized protein n=1 Tax=Dreissena polymorpha TaxID=45954 RepID=A0A9D4M2E6_DREPO|nr:hypothetical protein DPMN_032771 [Dreissena polymorpha]
MKVQASTYFQWGPLVLLKRQQAEETVLGYKESGCDTLALFEELLGSFTCSVYSTDTRENYLGFIPVHL